MFRVILFHSGTLLVTSEISWINFLLTYVIWEHRQHFCDLFANLRYPLEI